MQIARLSESSGPVFFDCDESVVSFQASTAGRFSPTPISVENIDEAAVVRVMADPTLLTMREDYTRRRDRGESVLASVELMGLEEAFLTAHEPAPAPQRSPLWSAYLVALPALSLILGWVMHNLALSILGVLGVVLGLVRWLRSLRPPELRLGTHVDVDWGVQPPRADGVRRGLDVDGGATGRQPLEEF